MKSKDIVLGKFLLRAFQEVEEDNEAEANYIGGLILVHVKPEFTEQREKDIADYLIGLDGEFRLNLIAKKFLHLLQERI